MPDRFETWPKHAEIYVEGQGHVVYWPHYFSTYCIHDRHDECRQTCKHCEERCRCSCHPLGSDGPRPPALSPEVRKERAQSRDRGILNDPLD